MLVGGLPSEDATIVFLNALCNLLYGISIFVGFLLFPRGYMLVVSLLTLFIGPAVILVAIGVSAGVLVAFTTYPVVSVLVMWTFFFLTSKIAQVLGRKCGLDHDGDGDVDLLDLLHWLAQTRVGRALDLAEVHAMFNDSSLEPLREINRKLLDIQSETQTIGKRLSGRKGEENKLNDRKEI